MFICALEILSKWMNVSAHFVRSIKHTVRCSSASEFTYDQRPKALRLFRAYLYSARQFDKGIKTTVGENVREAFRMDHNESDPDKVKYIFERGA
jgi:hypothetical protein